MSSLCPTCLGKHFVYSPGGYAPKIHCPTCGKGPIPKAAHLYCVERPAVVSDEVVEAMARGFLEGLNEGRSLEFDALQPGDWAELRSAMRSALALLPGGVPDGYVLVPREPTEAMIRSGQGAADDKYWLWRGLGERPVGSGLDGMALYVDAAYRAMLSASPKEVSQ